ncbi:MAG: acyltransferase [Oscillospiraceae bacterium]
MASISVTDTAAKKRYDYLDNLKVLLTCLVIAHHTSQAYGPTGGEWVYHNANGTADWLGNFMAVNAAFFMGLFFMISGYFIPQSFTGRTTACFISQKAKRLLLPVLLIMTVIVPVYFYLAANFHAQTHIGFIDYYIHTYLGTWIVTYEHGWYMVNLFLYALAYAVIMRFFKVKENKRCRAFRVWYLFALAAAVGVLSFFTRMIFPIDTWINLFGVIGMEPAHVPQYVLFFAAGILAFRHRFFENLPKRVGFITFSAGVVMAAVIYLSDVSFIRAAMSVIWDSWAFYEAFMAVFLSVGLIVVFRELCSQSNGIMRLLARCAFGAYVIHNLFVVSFQLLFDQVRFGASWKFVCVSVLSIFASFLAAWLAVRVLQKIKKIKAKTPDARFEKQSDAGDKSDFVTTRQG